MESFEISNKEKKKCAGDQCATKKREKRLPRNVYNPAALQGLFNAVAQNTTKRK